MTVAPRPLSTEARGRLRELWVRLENDALIAERAADALPVRLLTALEKKAEVGRVRTLAHVLRAMPIRPLYSDGRSLCFRYLKPMSTVPAAAGAPGGVADDQPCIVIWAVLLNAAGRPRMSREPFGACFTRHALGRLLDRSGMRGDPIAAMFAAHDALAALPVPEGAAIFDRADFLVPAAGGCFSAAPRVIGARKSPLAVCRTWFDDDALHADQAAHVAAWRRTDRAA
jgi:hypothetical protein